jgi:ATP-dependent DNA ligase
LGELWLHEIKWDGFRVIARKAGARVKLYSRPGLTVRKTTLASLVARAGPGLRFNEHIEVDGSDVFNHACKLGLEGIVSKRKESRYRSGRSPDWIKSKNPNAPAVKREAEIDWRR